MTCIRFHPALLFLSAALWLPNAGLAGEAKGVRNTYPLTYEGGNLPLGHNRVKASFERDRVVLWRRGQRIAVPGRDITEISCGSHAHRRLGAAVLNVLPRVHIGEAEAHYVGLTWADRATRSEVLFRVSGSDYRQFLASLERMTGKKAVDTGHVPTVVHYAL